MDKTLALSQYTTKGFFDQFVHLLAMMFEEDQNSGLC